MTDHTRDDSADPTRRRLLQAGAGACLWAPFPASRC
jgi:hypothetical protein